MVPASAEALRWIDSFLDAALVLPLPRPPAELRGRLRASFARHRTLHAEPPIDGERLELVADSRRDRTLVGVRSAESGGDARFELAFSR